MNALIQQLPRQELNKQIVKKGVKLPLTDIAYLKLAELAITNFNKGGQS